MKRRQQIFEPVTMSHIRSHGVTRLLVYCGNAVCCHHSAKLDGDFLPDETQLIPLERRMVCTKCGPIGADVSPPIGHRPGRHRVGVVRIDEGGPRWPPAASARIRGAKSTRVIIRDAQQVRRLCHRARGTEASRRCCRVSSTSCPHGTVLVRLELTWR
jgi:hypothetical protein